VKTLRTPASETNVHLSLSTDTTLLPTRICNGTETPASLLFCETGEAQLLYAFQNWTFLASSLSSLEQ